MKKQHMSEALIHAWLKDKEHEKIIQYVLDTKEMLKVAEEEIENLTKKNNFYKETNETISNGIFYKTLGWFKYRQLLVLQKGISRKEAKEEAIEIRDFVKSLEEEAKKYFDNLEQKAYE